MLEKLKTFSKPIQGTILVTTVLLVFSGAWVAWWLGSPLFLPGETSNEDLSRFDNLTTPTSSTTSMGNPSDNKTTTPTTTSSTNTIGEPRFTLVGQGEFVRIDNNHWGMGTVKIFNSSTGEKTLVFVDVEIANGPALIVYLSTKATFSGTADDAGTYISLGDLKANVGNFTMDIPESTDLTQYNSVLIWCEPFQVVFTWATLSLP